MTATRGTMDTMRYITIVDVTDPGDIEAGIRPYAQRFEFDDEHEAWLKYHLAIAAGFTATAEKVRTNRILEGV